MIPEMTDPMGRFWEQPKDIRSAPMDSKTVLLTQAQFDSLLEYSSTMPTGVYPGKCWKRLETNHDGTTYRNLLVWYGEETKDGMCPILYRKIEVC